MYLLYSSLSISARFNAMQACPNSYFVVVIEDTLVGEVVGSATLAVEQKFIRRTKCVSTCIRCFPF